MNSIGVFLFAHSFLAIVCYYLTYCAKQDVPELKLKPSMSFCIGFMLGLLGLNVVLLLLFYEIGKNHIKGE